MPAADELQAERVSELVSAVRQTIDAFRYRRIGPTIGGPEATLRGQWVALSLSLLVVFACFFAIGRLTRSGAPSVGASAALEGSSPRAAIPDELSGESPAGGSVPVAVVAKPRARAQPARANAARPLSIEATGASAAAATTPRIAATPQTATAVGSEPATPARPTTPTAPGSGSSGTGSSPGPGTGGDSGSPAGKSGSPGGSSRGAGSSGSGATSSGGGSFDTSG